MGYSIPCSAESHCHSTGASILPLAVCELGLWQRPAFCWPAPDWLRVVRAAGAAKEERSGCEKPPPRSRSLRPPEREEYCAAAGYLFASVPHGRQAPAAYAAGCYAGL